MSKIPEKSICDIKSCKTSDKSVSSYELPVRFMTEQTEGMIIGDPYMSIEKLDLCSNHLDMYVTYLPIQAYGAQGFNTYEESDNLPAEDM